MLTDKIEKETLFMEYFTTELIKTITKGDDIKEFFRLQIEQAINQILKNELTVFLDYERYDPIGYNLRKFSKWLL